MSRALWAPMSPVCLSARSAWMTGIGERIVPLDAPPLHAVLVNPGRALPTALVYRAFDAMELGGNFTERAPPAWRGLDAMVAGAAALGNDLAAPARTLEPEIARVEAALQADARALSVSLSGSGATVFALTASAEAAAGLALTIGNGRPDWWIAATRLGVLDGAVSEG